MGSLAHEDWVKLASEVTHRSQAFVGGEFVESLSGKSYENRNPATGELLATVDLSDDADVDRAVKVARETFESGVWSRAAVQDRKRAILRFADLLDQHIAELSLLDSLDMGKRAVDAHEFELPFSIDLFRYYAEAIDKITDEIAPTPPGTLALIRKVPVGVVAAVIPWNYPVDMLSWKVAPALAAGNSIVLKPAKESPSSALRLAELAVEAGIPAGVFNVLPGTGQITGKALGMHGDVDTLAFTGSTEVGHLFQRYSADSNLKQTWLELGGKSPFVVFADADDLEAAARQSAFDITYNQGAVCSAHTRVLVERSVQDEFVSLVGKFMAEYRPGDPLDPTSGIGAISSPGHTDRVMGFIDRAKQISDPVVGGSRLTIGGSDNFIEPTLFNNVDPASELAKDEIFGPVLAVTPFDTEEEAIRLANDSQYGLAASVATGSLSRAHRLADLLEAGTVTVNGVDAFSAVTPFGGFKRSGFGRDLSLHALDKYLGLKTVWINY